MPRVSKGLAFHSHPPHSPLLLLSRSNAPAPPLPRTAPVPHAGIFLTILLLHFSPHQIQVVSPRQRGCSKKENKRRQTKTVLPVDRFHVHPPLACPLVFKLLKTVHRFLAQRFSRVCNNMPMGYHASCSAFSPRFARMTDWRSALSMRTSGCVKSVEKLQYVTNDTANPITPITGHA